MTEDRWEQITSMIKKNFEIEEHDKEDLDPGESEYYVFEGPMGKMRIELNTRPKMLDRKVHGSTRIGGESNEEIIYSDTETVSFMNAYKWDEIEDDWMEIDLEKALI